LLYFFTTDDGTSNNKPYGENVTSSKHAASMQQACNKQAAGKQQAAIIS